MSATYAGSIATEKVSYVSDTTNPANSTPLSLALRQTQQSLRTPLFWMVVGVAIVLTAFAGPYYTLERFTFAERLVYWGSTHVLSATLMTFVSIFAYRLTEAHNWNWMIVSGLAGLFGIPWVAGSIYLAEAIAAGAPQSRLDLSDFWMLCLAVAPPLIAVTMLINGIIAYQSPDNKSQTYRSETQGSASPGLTPLQSKLPLQLGHDIVSVQAQDHYIEVTTPLGQATILMRLSDAVLDLAPLNGQQVHRSWWVSLAHIERIERAGHVQEIVLSTGHHVPVGRSFRSKLRDTLENRPKTQNSAT